MKPITSFALTCTLLSVCSCVAEPYELGEPKTLLSVNNCNFYEQGFANKGEFKGDPWVAVSIKCTLDTTTIDEVLFETRYPSLYRIQQAQEADTGGVVEIEYCRYRKALSVADLRSRIDALLDQYGNEIPFDVTVTENKEPCIAHGSELYE